MIRRQLQRFEEARWQELVAPAIAIGLTSFVVYAMLMRLRLSVEPTDEAFSTVLAYRFALGDQPFIDEINSAQTAGMIVTPFVWLYVKIAGSTDGIIIFMRLLFLVAKLALAATVFSTTKRHMRWPLALVTSFFCVVFVPHSIPNLGYNMLGSGFLTAGSWVAVRRFAGGTPRDLFGAGILQALAAWAYPPLVVPVVLLGFIFLFMKSGERVRDVAHYVAGGAVIGALVAPFLIRAGLKPLRTMIDYGRFLSAPRNAEKLYDIVFGWWTHSPVSWWIVPVVAVVVVGLKVNPRWSVWVLPLFVASLALGYPIGTMKMHVTELPIVIYAGLFAPVFLIGLWGVPFCRSLFVVVWIPSILAGLMTAFGSGNGEVSGALGLFPAAVVFLVYQAMAVERLAGDGKLAPSMASMTLLGPAVMVLSFLARFTFGVYRDGTPSELTYRVPSGPFRGLYTTHPRFLEVTELEQVFKKHEDPAGRVLVYFDYPGAYIFTRMRPAANTVWPVANWEPQVALEYYRKRLTGHGFAVKLKDSSNGTPIDRLIEANGPALETTSMFIVFAEPRP